MEFLSFAELRARSEIDIIGGVIEINEPDSIRRGKITDIAWDDKGYPESITWTEALVWDSISEEWKADRDDEISFDPVHGEYFFGPYETDRGEIFFNLDEFLYFAIFPKDCEPTPVPFEGYGDCELPDKTGPSRL